MKKPVYPKIGQLCQIKMENTRHCPLMGKSYKILDWLGNNDIFLVINVIFGTVASPYAYKSFAPCLIIPPCSWLVPGKNPGTSTNVTIGILNESQKRTNRAAFTDASMSRHPANING